MGQLLSPRLRLENNSGQRWRFEYPAAIHGRSAPSRRVPALQPVRRSAHTYPHLHALRVPADLRVARTYPAQPGGSLGRPRRIRFSHFPYRDPAPGIARCAGRRDLRLRAQPGRFPGPAAARRTQRHYDLERGGQPVRRGIRLAAGRGHLIVHVDLRRVAANHHRTPGKTLELPMKRAPWLRLHAVLVFAFLYLPIAVLCIYSFNGESVGGFPPHGWTLRWYAMLLNDDALLASVGNSLMVAAAAMAIALLLGFPAPGAAAADPARHHHRPLAADAFRGRGHASQPADYHARSRHRVDLRGYHRDFRWLAEARPRAGGSFARSRRQSVADVLARHRAQLAALYRWRGPADLHAFHGRNCSELLSDRAQQYAAARNLVALAPRDYARNQCCVRRHLRFLAADDR